MDNSDNKSVKEPDGQKTIEAGFFEDAIPIIFLAAGALIIFGFVKFFGLIGTAFDHLNSDEVRLADRNISIQVNEDFRAMSGLVFKYDSGIENKIATYVQGAGESDLEILIETQGTGIEANYRNIGKCSTGAKLTGKVSVRDLVDGSRSKVFQVNGLSKPYKVVRETCSGYDWDAMDELHEQHILAPLMVLFGD